MTVLHDPATHRLGRRASKPPRVMIHELIDLERAQATLAIPQTINNTHPAGRMIPLAMYLNDTESDCTFATIGNTLRVNSRGNTQLSDSDVQTGYIAVTAKENHGQGYNPATGANDNGCAELDVLDYWATVGVGGHKLTAHAGVDMANLAQVRTVCYLTGTVYLGVELAVEQQHQAVWDYVPASQPGSWGGHAVPLLDIWGPVDRGGYRVGTWGAYKQVTRAFLDSQCDEGHALITPEWLAAHQNDPIINTQALTAAIAQLAKET